MTAEIVYVINLECQGYIGTSMYSNVALHNKACIGLISFEWVLAGFCWHQPNLVILVLRISLQLGN